MVGTHNIRVGDTVQYVGDNSKFYGKTFTVRRNFGTGSDVATVVNSSGEEFSFFGYNLRFISTPDDCIQIVRDSLPEVSEDTLYLKAGNYCFSKDNTAEFFRKEAYIYLALSEHLENQETEMKNTLNERRSEMLKKHGLTMSFEDAVSPVQSMVDALIGAESFK